MSEHSVGKKKYLLFSMARRNTGMDNVFAMLARIFKEARYLGRIPAIGKFTIGPLHNLGKVKSDFCFEDYLDLSNGIVYRFERGFHRIAASRLEWIKEEDLDLRSYFFDKVYFISDEEIVTEEMNNRYDIIVRRDPAFKYVQTHKRYKNSGVLIDFPYSETVNRLTDEILGIFGTSRAHAIAAQHYFLNWFNRVGFSYGGTPENILASDISLEANYYACMHVRASINDRDYEQPIFTFGALKKQIEMVLSEAIAKGSQLYIMSDIHQPDFFDFLKSDYKIYRYHDFPQLKQLVSGKGKRVDNVMLYLVEKNIMKHATVKILPPHKGPMVYHLNTVYDLSFLKNPPTQRSRPTEFQKFIDDGMQKLGLKRILDGIAIR